MAFSTPFSNDPNQVQAGERFGSTQVILSSTTFENGLKVGRFAKLDTGSIDNLDASATPVIAGVVLSNVASAVEDSDAVDSTLCSQVDYVRQGLVTVEVKAGETPAQFTEVFAHNVADADAGKALAGAGAGAVATGAEFIQQVQANVWLVRLK